MELWLGTFSNCKYVTNRNGTFTKKLMKQLFLFHKNESLETN